MLRFHRVSVLLPHSDMHHAAECIFRPWQSPLRRSDFSDCLPSLSSHSDPVPGREAAEIHIPPVPDVLFPWQEVPRTDNPHPDSVIHDSPERYKTVQSLLSSLPRSHIRSDIPEHPATGPFPAVP